MSAPSITYVEFREQLRQRLMSQAEKVLLRIVVAPDFDEPQEFSGKAIVERAEMLASSFRFLKERCVVLLLLPHSPELFLLQLGLVLRGHIPAVLAWPTSRVDPEKYQRNLVHQLSQLPADHLITLPHLAENLASSLPYGVAGLPLPNDAAFEKLFPVVPVSDHLERHEFRKHAGGLPGEETVFLQFSGGSTGTQKAIVVTASMLLEQFRQLAKALAFTSRDSVASWLPLYHDMGLIACYWMPLWHGGASLHMAANDWVINPELLLKYIARYRATLCWLPNFSFSYISQRREQMHEHALSSVRAWINCSEPVRLKSFNEFAAAFVDCGVRKESLQASYAMAETVFAVTQTELNREPSAIHRQRVRHAKHTLPLAFDLLDEVYVSSGKPLEDTEIKIVTADGMPCAEAVPGEIYLRTPSLFSGYWGREGFQTHSLRDGWHASGDFGFLARGELYVIGRYKDIVMVGGNNIFPEDVEAVVNSVEGIYRGRVVAFGVEDREIGTQSLGVVAEMKGKYSEEAAYQLEAAIRKFVLAAIGTAARYVAVVPQRWIVKSTAGKISRRETRERFLRERLGGA